MLTKGADIGRPLAKKKKSRTGRCHKKRVIDCTLLAASLLVIGWLISSPSKLKPAMKITSIQMKILGILTYIAKISNEEDK